MASSQRKSRTTAVQLRVEVRMSIASHSANKKTRRVEFRADQETDDLITEAAKLSHVTKSTFVVEAARREAAKIVARADQTLMDADVFDALIGSLESADESPELEKLAKLPTLLDQ